ncbi:MAG: class I SAM-dependent methyltransferase [Candidatus Omnitrophica bacterium]|nr:class I SAM-dependent methyltransferase [Candidatus Omnitrophota bacterium]
MIDLKKRVSKLSKSIAYLVSRRNKAFLDKEITLLDIKKTFPDVSTQYLYFHNYYWHRSPKCIREHRSYFKKNGRGFGEDAFHAMWYLLFKEFRPKTVLEIGVYRGQTISLWALLSKILEINTEVHGISPFSSKGDSVTRYAGNINYYQDVTANFEKFELSRPQLHRAYSTDEEAKQVISSKKWDMIYIDGNHDYDVAKADFLNCSKEIAENGLLVLDDSALHTGYIPPLYSSAGHPGPSKVAKEMDGDSFTEIVSCGHNRVFMKKPGV